MVRGVQGRERERKKAPDLIDCGAPRLQELTSAWKRFFRGRREASCRKETSRQRLFVVVCEGLSLLTDSACSAYVGGDDFGYMPAVREVVAQSNERSGGQESPVHCTDEPKIKDIFFFK